MTFDEVLEQVRELLQSKGRVAYRALKRRFELDDEYLEDLKAELIDAEHVAHDEDGKVLVWTGSAPVSDSTSQVPRSTSENEQRVSSSQSRDARPPDGERRQLTVEFIDLVGSTTLSQQLDPEDYHARVVAYQTVCQQVIARYEGHIAQYLGDGVLVYFGYPMAHEEDAVRAVRSGLEIVTAVSQLVYTPPLQVRIGIHTGPVVVGEIGAGEHTERLALGETPNIAARVQGQANPDEVVISAATYRLVGGLFTCEDRGQPELKGVATPLTLYQVVKESDAHTHFEVSVQKGLTPLVGRESELGLLRQRWEQATEGEGQVVLLSGEPGIGKSRLVQELKDQIAQQSAVRIEFRCSPYYQNSALYPILEHVQQVLHFTPGDTPQAKLQKLAQTLGRYRFPQPDTVLLLAAFLSLPHPEAASLTLTPQQQKQKTLDALFHWLFEEAEYAAVYTVWEDLHWADPSTLEFLALCLDQVPTTRMLMLLTFRPEFTPTWTARSHVSHLVLSRLGRKQTSAIVEQLTGGAVLPTEVLQQIVSKTDGVPLFVEELTKSVLESGKAQESLGFGGRLDRSVRSLGIPVTLQDALMARLDRLGTAKEVAQQGAVVGRELTYELLSAISSLSEATLQQELTKLVEAELLYQRGRPPQATYLFKHALVQETAYQSLLKSKRQHYHRQIAEVFETCFPDTAESQPELVAHHYTEAGLGAQAIVYWQRAGEQAVQRSANAEAITHLTKGLDLLPALPDTPERSRQELTLCTALGPALIATKGNAAPEVEQTYARAVELCRQIGETPQLFPVLFGLRSVYLVRGEVQRAHELGEQLLSLAESAQDSGFLLEARVALGNTSCLRGDSAFAQTQFEHALRLYDPQRHRSHTFVYGLDPGVFSLCRMCHVLWFRGYPDQALQKAHDALALAQEISHSFSSAIAGLHAAEIHLFRREPYAAQQHTEATITLCVEHKFANILGQAMIYRGWVLAQQGLHEEGIAQIRQGLVACQATGAVLFRSYYLAFLADSCCKAEQTKEGLNAVVEALAVVDKNGERLFEAELYRLKGELTLQEANQKAKGKRQKSKVETNPQSLTFNPQREVEEEAEGYFLKAIDIARRQSAKSLELRATVSLARLWQCQGKRRKDHQMLSDIYGWFTEGLDTKDLREAKALLDELS
jgi:predicted ATPase/class 3 adenylate cyclase